MTPLKNTPPAEFSCPINCAIDAFGSKASLLILRQIFYGDRRFDALVTNTGISEATVAKRLHELVGFGILQKVPYQEPGARLRHEYQLTETGEELLPVILILFQWGQKHLTKPDSSLQLLGPDNQPIQVSIRSSSGEELHISELHVG